MFTSSAAGALGHAKTLKFPHPCCADAVRWGFAKRQILYHRMKLFSTLARSAMMTRILLGRVLPVHTFLFLYLAQIMLTFSVWMLWVFSERNYCLDRSAIMRLYCSACMPLTRDPELKPLWNFQDQTLSTADGMPPQPNALVTMQPKCAS